MRLSLLLHGAKKSKLRRPMDGRTIGRKKELRLWPNHFGELDEEVEVHGVKQATRDRVPEIIVPDLKDFKLLPYVTYRADDVHEAKLESKDLFDVFYAPQIQAEAQNIPIETLQANNEAERKGTLLTKSKLLFAHAKKAIANRGFDK